MCPVYSSKSKLIRHPIYRRKCQSMRYTTGAVNRIISLFIVGKYTHSFTNSTYRFYNTLNTLSHLVLVHHSMTELYQSRHDSSTDAYKNCTWENSYMRSVPSGGIFFLKEREARPVTPSLSRGRASTSTACPVHRARICKPFKEPRHRFPAWRAGTTTLYVVPARHVHRQVESIPRIRFLVSLNVYKYGLRSWVNNARSGSAMACQLSTGSNEYCTKRTSLQERRINDDWMALM
jgi:hypothetical protein